MNPSNERKTLELSPEDLARLGDGALAYIKEIEGGDAAKLLGSGTRVPARARLFCLYNADGTPVSISDSRDGAIGSAFEHELLPMSLH